MTKMLQLPTLLEAAGVNVRVLDGWDTPARGGYYWREMPNANTALSNPAGVMHHHTASSGYTPNREKANGWAGLSYKGSARLYQERYEGEGYEPVLVIANAFPAPFSSGAGDIGVLEKVRAGERVSGRPGPDTPGWYGNTHYFNYEWVLNGTGAQIDMAVWEMMAVANRVINTLMKWTPTHHIMHATHTNRKIDLRDGRYADFDATLTALRTAMIPTTNPPPIEPPPEGDPVDIGRNIEYVKEGQSGLDVEYWQVRIIEVVKATKFYGRSNRAFIQTEAPELTWKVWDQAMTDYLSAWTQRNSYGVGPTERVMIENALNELYG